MNNNHLQGKTAIITGAGYATLSDGRCGSIGYGIATAFAKEGANLVITGRQIPKLEKAKAELERLYGVKVLAIPADISAGADNAATAKAVVDAVKIPVTVKTRLGWDHDHRIIVDLAEQLQDCGIEALTVHGRTRAQMYTGEADWTLIGEVKNNPRMTIPIIGNGDVVDGPSAKYFLDNFGVDGLMIGRATYGNPWIFREVKHYLKTGEILPSPDVCERVRVSLAHLVDSLNYKKDELYAVMEMRKHWGLYFKGYANFKQFKLRLMEAKTIEEVSAILDEVVNFYNNQ